MCSAASEPRFLYYDIDEAPSHSEMKLEAKNDFRAHAFPCTARKHTRAPFRTLRMRRIGAVQSQNNILHLPMVAYRKLSCNLPQFCNDRQPRIFGATVAVLLAPTHEALRLSAEHRRLRVSLSHLLRREGVGVYWLLGLVMAALMMFLGASLCAYRKYRRRQRRKHVIVRNPMVIVLGQAFYDPKPKSKEYKGYLRDLDGIDVDVRNLVTFFRALNYRVCPQYDSLEFP